MATKSKKTATKAPTIKTAKAAKAIEKTLANHPTLGLVTKEPKTPRNRRGSKSAGGKLSCLDAAAKVLGESKTPMTTKAMIEAMAKKKYWTSPGGKTPSATLYSAILRELGEGKDSRFKKTERGKFALNG